MKFQPVREGEYRAYSNPFTFWLFEGVVVSGLFDVVWHYGDSAGSEHNLPSLDAAKQFCYEFALKATLKQLQEIAPEGGRTDLIDYQYQFVCNGAVPDMGYYCCKTIGHTGDCYTRSKRIHFKREN